MFECFLKSEVIDFGNSITEGLVASALPINLFKNINYVKALENFMTSIDTGIFGIRVEEFKDTINFYNA